MSCETGRDEDKPESEGAASEQEWHRSASGSHRLGELGKPASGESLLTY